MYGEKYRTFDHCIMTVRDYKGDVPQIINKLHSLFGPGSVKR